VTKQMAMSVYNPRKGCLETIDAAITQDNTTCFEHCVQDHDIHSITDFVNLAIPYGYMAYREWISDTISGRRRKSSADTDRIASSPRDTGLASQLFPTTTGEELSKPRGGGSVLSERGRSFFQLLFRLRKLSTVSETC